MSFAATCGVQIHATTRKWTQTLARKDIGVHCSIDSAYHVPVECLDESELQAHMKTLTMVTIDMGFGSQSFDAYRLTDSTLSVPRFYGQTHFGNAGTNRCARGEAMECAFVGSLTDHQKTALHTIDQQTTSEMHAKGNILCLPCGYGKTVAALHYICSRQRKALVLVSKSFLMEQWTSQAQKFVPTATIGRIQRDVFDVGDITIGMIQSLCAREYTLDRMSVFGTVVIDEAHHQAARHFSQALWHVPAEYVLGLSATPDRKDGLTDLLMWSMGEVGFRAERQACESVHVNVVVYEGGVRSEIRNRDGKVNMASMTTRLCADDARTSLIVDRIARAYESDRCTIVLSDRLEHLRKIHAMLLSRPMVHEGDVGWYVGSTSVAERAKTETESRIILTTYMMAKEGLDIKRLDTLVMATPKSDIEQCIGRIQRPNPNKKAPVVEDIVDPYSIFGTLRWKRVEFYKKHSYTFDVQHVGDTSQHTLFP